MRLVHLETKCVHRKGHPRSHITPKKKGCPRLYLSGYIDSEEPTGAAKTT